MKIVATNDKELEKTIRAAVQANDGHCPCRIEKSADTKCMCKEFRDGDTLGACHCGLYVKVEL